MAYIITNDCIMCDACLPECPNQAIAIGDPAYVISPSLCDDCGDCAEVCPTEACVPLFDDEE